jgi:signal transduction histidine kinase
VSDLLTDNVNDGAAIPVRFTRLYLTLLVSLTILLIIGQGVTQWRLRVAQDELWVIRYAALQRHQSQQIAKLALQLADPNESNRFNTTVAELRQVFPTFERYHLQGREGKVYEKQVTVQNSSKVQLLYDEIRPEFNAYRKSASRLMALRTQTEARQPDVQASIKLLLANEKPFLEEIDSIVREYTGELRAKLTTLQYVEFYLFMFTILVLVGIGLLIFRPAARRLKETFAQLLEAQNQTIAANRKLLSANKSLKETRQQLFEATRIQHRQEMDEQKTRTSYLIAGQEEERKRLSRDLHDGLGQMLTAIKLQIEGLEANIIRNTPPELKGEGIYSKNLKTLKNLVTQTIQETRTISNDLMPSVLSDFGIVPAIKMLAENDRSDTIDVTFKTNLAGGQARLDKNLEIMLYRVTQEAVSNAVRHAAPSHIHIELMDEETFLCLEITDDGRGFEFARNSRKGLVKSAPKTNEQKNGTKIQRAPSQGLHNMQERAKLLNAKFKLSSTPGKGTRVQVKIPH